MTIELKQEEVIEGLHPENQELFDNKEYYIGKLFYSFGLEENFLLLSVEKIVKRSHYQIKFGRIVYRTSLVFRMLTKEKIEEYSFPLPWCKKFSLVAETNQE